MARTSKYHAKKTEVDGIVFDSKKEAERYMTLKAMQEAGEIKDLELQKPYKLIPLQRGTDGKIKERECMYKADFCYTTKDGEFVVEDTKGVKTPEYIIKRKLMLYRYNIAIHET